MCTNIPICLSLKICSGTVLQILLLPKSTQFWKLTYNIHNSWYFSPLFTNSRQLQLIPIFPLLNKLNKSLVQISKIIHSFSINFIKIKLCQWTELKLTVKFWYFRFHIKGTFDSSPIGTTDEGIERTTREKENISV